MSFIQKNLQKIHNRIANITSYCGRNPKEITLLAASKNQPSCLIEEAIKKGQYIFGENYVQEAIKKIAILNKYPHIEWHFIGSLQSNKTNLVAKNFSWCHTIDRIRIAQRLHIHRPDYLPPLNVLIQININNESNKSGITVEQIPILVKQISSLFRLRFRGLSAIPAIQEDYQLQIKNFHQLASVFYDLKTQYPHVDTLSLGMSNDMEAAIMSGSTLIRIGTAIFGPRK